MSDSGANFNLPLQLMWKTTFLEVPLTLMSDSLRFAGQRLAAQSHFFATLNRCSSVPEFIESQSEFTRKAIADYGTQTSRIMDGLRAKTGNGV
jgi:hypothetical protein